MSELDRQLPAVGEWPALDVIAATPQLALAGHDASLLELLDRAIDKGVVVAGDLRLAVADVDLLQVGVRLVVTSLRRLHRTLPEGGMTARW